MKWSWNDISTIIDLDSQEPKIVQKPQVVHKKKAPKRIKKKPPKRPEGSPGCWGSYKREQHCRERCQIIYSDKVRKTCMEKTKFKNK